MRAKRDFWKALASCRIVEGNFYKAPAKAKQVARRHVKKLLRAFRTIK